MNENKLIAYILTLIVGLTLFIAGPTSCTSSTRIVDDENGRDAIQTLGKLESQIEQFDRRIESITNRAENFRDELTVFTEQFECYVDCVRTMRSELEQYRERIRDKEETKY